MAKETVVSNFALRGREILSSYASFTLEGEITAKVSRGKETWTITERNGIPKGTSDGENEAVYIPNDKAIKSIEKNIAPLLPKKVVIRSPSDILDAAAAFDLQLVDRAGPNKKNWGGNACLAARGDLGFILDECAKVGVNSLEDALENIEKGGFSAFLSHRSTEGSSEFLPYMPLLYGPVSKRLWLKAGAPNGERNLQNYNPLIRAEEQIRARGIKTAVPGFAGLPAGVKIPALQS